jgi:lysophospholipase L1-like esterase
MSNRRDFLKTVAGTAVVSNLADPLISYGADEGSIKTSAEPGLTVLFQGDSITDGNRTRNTDWNHVMGHGYACNIAGRLWYDYPSKGFHFFNRGISGNRITHLSDRWQTDTFDLKPDVLSILVGINDSAAFIKGDATCAPDLFETNYRSVLKQTIERLPAIKLALCEPFILPVGKVKDSWEVYKKDVNTRQAIVKRLALEFRAVHVPFQAAFDAALAKAPADYWIWDGIHPMPAGHELMTRFWLEKAGNSVGVG